MRSHPPMPVPDCEARAAALLRLLDEGLTETTRRGPGDGGVPVPPLDAVGMPPPGPDFLAAAGTLLGDAWAPLPTPPSGHPDRRAVVRANREAQAARAAAVGKILPWLAMEALFRPEATLAVDVKGRTVTTPLLSGHPLGFDPQTEYGPVRPYPVMVVGKCPGRIEMADRHNFLGPTSDALFDAMRDLGLADIRRAWQQGQYVTRFIDLGVAGDWYVTNICKHPPLDPSSDTIPQRHIRNGLWLLHMELRLVRPDFVLCFGAEAARAVMGVKGGLRDLAGRVVTLDVPLHREGEAPRVHTARVMACTHPAAVARKPELGPDLRSGLRAFAQMCRDEPGPDPAAGRRHLCLYTEAQLSAVVDRIIAQAEPGVGQPIAVDCEWHGRHPDAPGAYLRTVQFSHRPGEAYTVVLRGQHGRPVFRPGEAAARRHLNRLLHAGPGGRQVRPGGHAFRADLPWLIAFGVDIRAEAAVPDDPEATRDHGGWDTAFMARAYREDMSGYDLEGLAALLCGVPRYDVRLGQWKDAYCKAAQVSPKKMGGYGACPDGVLHPYAAFDADASIQLFHELNRRLDGDEFGLSGRRGYWLSMVSSPAALEMERTGIALDQTRCEELVAVFEHGVDRAQAALRARIGWPTFNHRSAPMCRELLFGAAHNGTRGPDDQPRRLSPPSVRTLDLEPVKAAGSKGKAWDQVVADEEEDLVDPGTDKESLGILGYAAGGEDGATIFQLRNLRFLDQVLKTVIRRPLRDRHGVIRRRGDGTVVYDGGLPWFVDHDGRLRTHFFAVETGRWSSSRPNLQNISKRREDDYQKILGELYLAPIRSMFVAAPGHVLVEADYKSAELAILAWMSGDPTFCERIERNLLPEDHADYIDLHSLTAVQAFGLDCAPTKKALKAIGKAGLRVAAKNVNFGVPYQRSAAAIARQCHEEGNREITVVDTQRLIDDYYAGYPMVKQYLDTCMERSQDPGWLRGAFGRYRRFRPSRDRSVINEQRRSASNFCIQNAVADAANLACRELWNLRAEAPAGRTFRFLLQIHDALIFEVPVADAAWFVREVLDEGMSRRVPIWPARPDGSRRPGVTRPYHLGIDVSVHRRWGVPLGRSEGLAMGVPAELLPPA